MMTPRRYSGLERDRRVSSLDSWIARKDSLPSPEAIERIVADHELGGYVGLEHRIPLHLACDLPPQSLETTWTAVSKYLSDAMELISNETEPGWLDREEAEMVIGELGLPPPLCLPLYLITVGTRADEQVMYVGKTSSDVPRFVNGHAAITRLHAPEFEGRDKHIYLASLVLFAREGQMENNSGHLPLEWIQPLETAKQILASVENALIFDLQPPLNENLRSAYRPGRDLSVSIQNFDGELLQWKQIAPVPGSVSP